METLFRTHKICAILRGIPLERTLDYAGAAFDGGIRIFEVALNSPDGYRQIALLRKQYDGQARIGAGTAITADKIRSARDAGAQFMLTPSALEDILALCRNEKIPLLPGVMTPSEVNLCIRYGFRTMKLFPAGDLPPRYIQSLKGPFDNTEYVAVGGITAQNITDFFGAGFLGVGIGSGLIPKAIVRAGDWNGARDHIARMVQKLTASCADLTE